MQRALVVYNSKPLINVFLQHRDIIQQIYHHQFLYSHRLKVFTLNHGLKELFAKVMEQRIEKKSKDHPIIPDNFATLCFLARQSQGCDKHEGLHQGSESSVENSLTLQEFMLLLVNIAVH